MWCLYFPTTTPPPQPLQLPPPASSTLPKGNLQQTIHAHECCDHLTGNFWMVLAHQLDKIVPMSVPFMLLCNKSRAHKIRYVQNNHPKIDHPQIHHKWVGLKTIPNSPNVVVYVTGLPTLYISIYIYYIYMYVYMYVCVYIYIYTHIYIYENGSTFKTPFHRRFSSCLLTIQFLGYPILTHKRTSRTSPYPHHILKRSIHEPRVAVYGHLFSRQNAQSIANLNQLVVLEQRSQAERDHLLGDSLNDTCHVTIDEWSHLPV
jgi:hypothetical protein